ncbi:MAG: fibrobacter succinogenes major paralogous domain-containing protein [Bacteroidota bacterium]
MTTTAMRDITNTCATSGGSITSDGGSSIIARGTCWGTSQEPTIDNDKTIDGKGMGIFKSNLTGLTPGTTYYARAFAINSAGTGYGISVPFITKLQTPVLVTTAISDTTYTTATSGGNVTSDGGSSVIARGICWGESPDPTIENNKTSDGVGVGSFASTIAGLSPNKIFYARAYATNSIGTAYGNGISFKTKSTVTDINGNVYNVVMIGTQIWMTQNLKASKYNDGNNIPNVTDNIVWSLLTAPGSCTYNNTTNSDSINKYGRLYNWYAVNTGKLSPSGWHIPTDAEWSALGNYLIVNGYNYDGSTSGNKYAKALASDKGWNFSSNTGVPGNTDYSAKRNATGFTAVPAGVRDANQNAFGSIGYYGIWWSSSEDDYSFAWDRGVDNSLTSLGRGSVNKSHGYSVRCIKD